MEIMERCTRFVFCLSCASLALVSTFLFWAAFTNYPPYTIPEKLGNMWAWIGGAVSLAIVGTFLVLGIVALFVDANKWPS